MKRLLLLGSQHGNEPLGDMLRTFIRRNHQYLLPCLTYKTANLRARRQGKRFIDSDMNRSYTAEIKGYEARRAARISHFITAGRFDLVLDLHTTNCHQPPSVIVHGLTDEKRRFLRSSSIEKIVDMRHEIVKQSLIGSHANAISIEISNHQLDANILEQLSLDIDRYIGEEIFSDSKELYRIDELLLKSSVPSGTQFENFVKSPLGFIPILTGENSYKKQTPYLGFQAKKMDRIKV